MSLIVSSIVGGVNEQNSILNKCLSVADPRFPGGGGISQMRCANLLFCRKLHENERIWIPGGARAWRPLRSEMADVMADVMAMFQVILLCGNR